MALSIETARTLEESGDYVGALVQYRSLYAEDSGNEDVILGIAQCALALDNPELAFEFFVKLLIQNHNNPWGYVGRANVLFRYAQTDRALSDLARAIELDNPATELRIDCAAVLNDNGFSDLAYETLQPIRKTHFEETDFQCEWIFAILVTDRRNHPDIRPILDSFAAHRDEDPFYTLCLTAWNHLIHPEETLPDISELLEDAPELVCRAQYLGLIQ